MEWLTQPEWVTPAMTLCHLHLSSPQAGDRHAAGDRESGCWCPISPKPSEEPGVAWEDAWGGEGMCKGAPVVGHQSYNTSPTPPSWCQQLAQAGALLP